MASIGWAMTLERVHPEPVEGCGRRKQKHLSNTCENFSQRARGNVRAECWITFRARIFFKISFVKSEAALEPSRSNPQLRYIPTIASKETHAAPRRAGPSRARKLAPLVGQRSRRTPRRMERRHDQATSRRMQPSAQQAVPGHDWDTCRQGRRKNARARRAHARDAASRSQGTTEDGE